MIIDSERMEDCFYGSATVGERGQVVIPADARRDCDMHPGDKLLVLRHPHNPHMLILAKIGEMQQLLEQYSRLLEKASMPAPTPTPNEEQ